MKPGRMRTILWILPLLCLPSAVAAQDDELQIPAEVRPFVEKGTKAIAVEPADLNGDGHGDYILVLERENPAKDENDVSVNQRPLLVLVRNETRGGQSIGEVLERDLVFPLRGAGKIEILRRASTCKS